MIIPRRFISTMGSPQRSKSQDEDKKKTPMPSNSLSSDDVGNSRASRPSAATNFAAARSMHPNATYAFLQQQQLHQHLQQQQMQLQQLQQQQRIGSFFRHAADRRKDPQSNQSMMSSKPPATARGAGTGAVKNMPPPNKPEPHNITLPRPFGPSPSGLQVVQAVSVGHDNRLIGNSDDILDCLGPLLPPTRAMPASSAASSSHVPIQSNERKRKKPSSSLLPSDGYEDKTYRSPSGDLVRQKSTGLVDTRVVHYDGASDVGTNPPTFAATDTATSTRAGKRNNKERGYDESISLSVQKGHDRLYAQHALVGTRSTGIKRGVVGDAIGSSVVGPGVLAPPPVRAAVATAGGGTTSTDDEYPASADETYSSANFVDLKQYQTELWDKRFQELLEFRQKHGTCVVPHAGEENPALAKLSKWVKRQRYQYKLRLEGKHSTLTDERQRALTEIGFLWDSHKIAWEEKFSQLLQYKNLHGHCNVPSKFKDNHSLSVWVQCQRRQYKLYQARKRSSMNPYRIDKLEQVGFEWIPTRNNNTKTPSDSNDRQHNDGSKKK